MASTASKTRPPAAGGVHRAVNSTNGTPKLAAISKGNGSQNSVNSSNGTVKKIKLTQKNNFQQASPSPVVLPRKPSMANVKNHLSSNVAISLATTAATNAINKKLMLEEDAYYKATGKLPKLEEYSFLESTEDILNKYKGHPPSIELHIHPTHYRFGNQDAIIPKNSPLIKNFLEMVELEQIPPAAVEIFNESGIRYYQGCIILQVNDHRGLALDPLGISTSKNTSPHQANKELLNPGAETSTIATSNHVNNSMDGSLPITGSQIIGAHSNNGNEGLDGQLKREPKVYRSLLRPTPLTMWCDLSQYADRNHGRYTDNIALALESKIVAATYPKIDLSVPSDKNSDFFLPSSLMIPPLQPEGIVDEFGRLRAPNLPTNAKRKKPLHEDLPHQGTEYEEIMLIMDEKPAAGTGQFLRLGFVEQWRRKRERERQQRLSQAGSNHGT
ncbi:Spt20 family-domain-containing protein, partial [Lipomyces japonicus]|uniref:Spt20 family-domain-containing protein n=1 Tax=Lipomyces japonicus TaxID=56871 RepID=UPI0034CDCA4B